MRLIKRSAGDVFSGGLVSFLPIRVIFETHS